MQQRKLGSDGPEVGAIGLGGMYLSILKGRPSEAQAIATVHAALDAGVTLIDTADVYCLDHTDIGHNERLIARAIAGRPGVVVATKGGLQRPGGDWTGNARPEHLRAACEASLRALGVERIALYQLHAPDPSVRFADSVGALARLRAEGKIERVGLSNVSAAQLAEAQRIVPIASVQNRWNPLHRAPETDGVLDACTREGIAFLPYSPFGGARGAKSLAGMGRLAEEAERRGVTAHQLVLAWMLAKSPVVIPIPGTRRPETARASAEAAAIPLSEADVAAIERSFT